MEVKFPRDICFEGDYHQTIYLKCISVYVCHYLTTTRNIQHRYPRTHPCIMYKCHAAQGTVKFVTFISLNCASIVSQQFCSAATTCSSAFICDEVHYHFLLRQKFDLINVKHSYSQTCHKQSCSTA